VARKTAAKTTKPAAPKKATSRAKAAAPRARKPAENSPSAEPAAPRAGAAKGRTLVIVESPKKARSIGKFLGSSYVVKASMGHVRDLPKRKMGLDVANGYAADYEVMPAKQATVGELKREAAKAGMVYLATDPDREGEAIAWHLREALDLTEERTRRVLFFEITEKAVREAFKSPGPIDMNKVNAQQARRFLDRFVGYELSPLLWKKVARNLNLSAGRVQSVAVRLIAEREKEIRAFLPVEYWKLTATVSPSGDRDEASRFDAELAEWKGAKLDAKNEATAHAIRDALARATYRVSRLERVERKDRPEAPFKTSTLQQQAAIRLRFSGKKTMKLAQELYEGIDVEGDGPVGLITYMRTDSLRVSDDALNGVRELIDSQYGPKYLPAKPNQYAAGKMAQEAHEAIRPTELKYHPDAIKDRLSPDQLKLYQLIYKRFVASQMTPAVFEVTDVGITAGEGLFKTQGRILRFDGYRRVLPPAGKQEDTLLPALAVDQALDLHNLAATQHFTQPPPRYSEATLIKALEKENIGRPSTYAPIIQTIQDRGYVLQQERRFFATELGMWITDYLVAQFPKIMDLKFTGHMEDELDGIVTGKEDFVQVLDEFYHPFKKELAEAFDQPPPKYPESDKLCHECGARMVIKFGKTGPFLSCSRYPDCRGMQQLDGTVVKAAEESGFDCPKCGKPLLIRESRKGEKFFSCSGYPSCKESFNIGPDGQPQAKAGPEMTEHKCPKCGKPMALRQSARGPFLGCTGYPKCRSTMPVDDQGKPVVPVQVDVPCPKCGGPMALKQGRRGGFLGCLKYPKCRGTAQLSDELKEKLGDAATAVAAPSAPRLDLKTIVVDEPCEQCGGAMVVRRGRRGPFLGCGNYPKCKNTREPDEATREKIAALEAGSAAPTPAPSAVSEAPAFPASTGGDDDAPF
jgi:DNA topoisomerase-1